MKKIILLTLLLFAGTALFAQDQAKAPTQSQYIFVIRYNIAAPQPSTEAMQANIKKWMEYMGNLAKNGNIVSGYRPTNDGETISGTDKTVKKGAYVANGELMSSILIIKANDIDDAKAIASKCPIFEFGGSVEVRPLMQTAGK